MSSFQSHKKKLSELLFTKDFTQYFKKKRNQLTSSI